LQGLAVAVLLKPTLLLLEQEQTVVEMAQGMTKWATPELHTLAVVLVVGIRNNRELMAVQEL
jgi:hypothetical protein